MVQYGRYIQTHRVPGWEEYYIDYKKLKRIIFAFETETVEKTEEERRESSRQFSELLDSQVEKTVLFFLEKQGHLASKLQDLGRLRVEFYSGNEIYSAPSLMDQYRDVGKELLLLLQFVEMNATGLRKILKKFDRRVGVPLQQEYIASRTQHPYSHLRQVFKQVGLGAMVGTILHNLQEIHDRQFLFPEGGSTPRLRSASPSSQALPPCEESRLLSMEGGSDLQVPRSPLRTASGTEPLSKRSSFILFRQGSFVLPPDGYRAEEEPIIQEIERARSQLTKAVSFSSFLAQNLLLPPPTAAEAEAAARREAAGEEEFHWWSLQLNQFNTFLYMVNYYIIVPTSDDYAVKLNAPASLCGAIIGATPFCALISAFVFSKWSNSSYKSPLIVSTIILLIGNLCYAVALDFNSVPLLLLGRALEGLGGARAINRRYISDHVPPKYRTSASAAFVSAGALGMAAGPFMAGMFNGVHMKFLGFTVNSVTSPGWLMAVIWALYLLLLLLLFKEPAIPKAFAVSISRREGEKRVNSSSSMGRRRASNGGGGEEGESGIRSSSAPTVVAGLGDLEEPLLAEVVDKIVMEEDEDEGRSTASESLAAVETLEELVAEVTMPVQILLFIYFMIKLASEVLVSESALVSKFYFQWSINDVGLFLGFLGLTVLPVSAAVGNYISNIYEDRLVVLWTEVIIGAGVVCIISFAPWVPYTYSQYILGAVIIFVACNVLEGVSLSLLSRVMSPRLARGTFNCGLLSTEAGTLARVLGDALISCTGAIDTKFVLNLTMTPVLIVVALSLYLTRARYYTLY